MTNVEALKALYSALGGDPADVAEDNLSAEVIAAMTGLEIGGGSEHKIIESTTTGATVTLPNGMITGDIYQMVADGEDVTIKQGDDFYRPNAIRDDDCQFCCIYIAASKINVAVCRFSKLGSQNAASISRYTAAAAT
jgi:hypothetical protein